MARATSRFVPVFYCCAGYNQTDERDHIMFKLFERSEFLIAPCEKKKTDRLCGVCVCGCTANLGFSVRSANRIRPKDGIPLPD